MKLQLFVLLLGIAWTVSVYAEEVKGTHQPKGTIEISTGESNAEIKTFCVDKKGRLLVAVGGTQFSYEMTADGNYEMKQLDMPSAIHVFDGDGKEVAVWAIEVTPQALAVGPDNAVYAAGMGKIIKLDENGKELLTVESPHTKALPPLPPIPDENEEETEEEKKARQQRLDAIQEELKAIVKRLIENNKATTQARKNKDEAAIDSLRGDQEKIVQEYSIVIQEQKNLQTTKRAAAIEARNGLLRSRSVRGIAVTKNHIFICVPPPMGYGNEVWCMNTEFGDAKVIVKKLSGCCGQMNIGAVDDKLVIPENGRMKVHLYDADGKRLESWGERDSVNADSGFGSCCNPMNVTCDAQGNILTSETSVGAVKRFKQNGEFLGLVAQATIIPGCNHTPIGLSLDGKKVYMLDITRRQIAVMEE